MNAVQIIRTPTGEEMVVLSRAEYDALVERADYDEDADDVAIYDARKAELAAGESVLPAQVSAAILRGQSRLKAVRLHCNVAQIDLAHKSGIGQGYLSDLENGRRVGTPETLAKIADALGTPIEWIS
jgi:DNA-binding XRE family transcriptional regulator